MDGLPAGFLETLPLLLPAALLWFLLFWSDLRARRRLLAVVGPRARELAATLSPRERAVKRLLGCTGVFLLTLVLARLPAAGDEEAAAGPDLMLCLDVSRSMLVRDVPPSRLQRARRLIEDLTVAARGGRIGLVAYAGRARLLMPPTRDLAALRKVVRGVGSLSVPAAGTDLGAALGAAVAELQGGRGIVLLLSDGEDPKDTGLAFSRELGRSGITIHAVGLGSLRGGPVPELDALGEPLDPVEGAPLSFLDEDRLRRIAEASGGRLLRLDFAARTAGRELWREIGGTPASENHPGSADPSALAPFLLLAALSFGLPLGLTERRRRP